MLSKNLVLILAVLAMVVALAACSAAGQPGGQGGAQNKQEAPSEEQAQNRQEWAPDKKMSEEAKEREVAPQQGNGPATAAGQRQTRVEPPKDTTMRLTVPKMAEIKNDTIPTGLGTNDALLREYAGVHLKRTGFPWQREANVYIAGHRIGFPGTDSDMAFYDLNELGEGDHRST